MSVRRVLSGMVVVVLLAGVASAYVAIDDFSDGNIDGWAALAAPLHTSPGDAAIGYNADLGGAQAMGITATTGPDIRDFIRINTDEFTGDYLDPTGILMTRVLFDFYSASGVSGTPGPASLEVYFWDGSGSASLNSWRLNVTADVAGGGWNSVSRAFSYSEGWIRSIEGDDAAFTVSLHNVAEIGLLVGYHASGGDGTQIYGLDDFALDGTPVPEPGTYAALAMAFISLGVTFRGKIKDVLAKKA